MPRRRLEPAGVELAALLLAERQGLAGRWRVAVARRARRPSRSTRGSPAARPARPGGPSSGPRRVDGGRVPPDRLGRLLQAPRPARPRRTDQRSSRGRPPRRSATRRPELDEVAAAFGVVRRDLLGELHPPVRRRPPRTRRPPARASRRGRPSAGTRRRRRGSGRGGTRTRDRRRTPTAPGGSGSP